MELDEIRRELDDIKNARWRLLKQTGIMGRLAMIHQRRYDQKVRATLGMLFFSAGGDTLNTGNGISISICEMENANAIVVVNKDGRIEHILAPNYEFVRSYAVGHGHYNSKGVSLLEVGEKLPEEFQSYVKKVAL